MPEDSTAGQGTGTGPDVTGQNQGQGNDQTASQGGSGSRNAVSDHGAAGSGSGQEAGDRGPEAMLADAAASGDGDGSGEDALKTAQAELARWKAQAREQEKRAKANAEKAKLHDAYVESQQTEQEKLAARLAAAEQRAAEAEGKHYRTLAAAMYDLPPSMIDQLGDGTEEEISERAEKLAAAINERAALLVAAQAQANGQQRNGAGNNGWRPVESLRPGGLPASDSRPSDPNAWVRNTLTAKRSK